jgi:hypothetical protein
VAAKEARCGFNVEDPKHAVTGQQRDMENALEVVTLRTALFEIRTYGPSSKAFFEILQRRLSCTSI